MELDRQRIRTLPAMKRDSDTDHREQWLLYTTGRRAKPPRAALVRPVRTFLYSVLVAATLFVVLAALN